MCTRLFLADQAVVERYKTDTMGLKRSFETVFLLQERRKPVMKSLISLLFLRLVLICKKKCLLISLVVFQVAILCISILRRGLCWLLWFRIEYSNYPRK